MANKIPTAASQVTQSNVMNRRRATGSKDTQAKVPETFAQHFSRAGSKVINKAARKNGVLKPNEASELKDDKERIAVIARERYNG